MDEQKDTTSNTPAPGTIPPVPPLEPQAPLPPAQADFLHPVADTPKHIYHPKRVMVALTAAVVVSLLIVGILVAYAIMPQRQATSKTTVKTDDTAKTATSLTAKQTLTDIGAILKDAKPAQQAIALPVIAPKKSFYTVVPDATPVQGLMTPVANEAVASQLKAVAKSLEANKFTAKSSLDTTDRTNILVYYTRDDVICQVSVTALVETEKTRNLEVDCLDIAIYTEYAAAQQPFASVYTPATSSSTYVAFTGKPTIRDSVTAGYKLSDIPVSTVIDQKLTSFGTVAAFYQASDGLWHYFLDHDSTVLVDCSKFNKTYLQYAYAGQACTKSTTAGQDVVLAPKTKK